MIEIKHTPGPWSVSFEGVDPEWAIVATQGGRVVANVNADHLQDANARLIAAAPELLSALAPFVAFFEHALRGHTPDYEHRSDPDKVVCGWNGAQLTMRDFGNARAALAKAEGRQH